ncbi:hypothetical protein Tco_0134511 [Tanacetum coccineum]
MQLRCSPNAAYLVCYQFSVTKEIQNILDATSFEIKMFDRASSTFQNRGWSDHAEFSATIFALLQKLLQQLASMSCTVPTPHSSNNAPVAFNMGRPTSFGPTIGPMLATPRGFSQPAHHSTAGPLTSGPSVASSLAQQ